MTSWVKLSKLLGAVPCAPKILRKKKKVVSELWYLRHPFRFGCQTPAKISLRVAGFRCSPWGDFASSSVEALFWYCTIFRFCISDGVCSGSLTVVAAGSLGLLVCTSKICTEKMAAAFTSFPVSLVGAVLRRSSSMLAIPLKRAF